MIGVLYLVSSHGLGREEPGLVDEGEKDKTEKNIRNIRIATTKTTKVRHGGQVLPLDVFFSGWIFLLHY